MGGKDKPDPMRVFNAIAQIIADRENVQITVKSIRKKEENKTA
ncbi:hypothetical protein [uncultured Robinsoniella sp.]|nr:hypothetical protein [Clostridiales bacterium]